MCDKKLQLSTCLDRIYVRAQRTNHHIVSQLGQDTVLRINLAQNKIEYMADVASQWVPRIEFGCPSSHFMVQYSLNMDRLNILSPQIYMVHRFFKWGKNNNSYCNISDHYFSNEAYVCINEVGQSQKYLISPGIIKVGKTSVMKRNLLKYLLLV